MVSKEGMSFLASSSPKQRDSKGMGHKIKKVHLWILAATLGLILCWNTILTVQSLKHPGGTHDFHQFGNTIKQEETVEVDSMQFSFNVWGLFLFLGA